MAALTGAISAAIRREAAELRSAAASLRTASGRLVAESSRQRAMSALVCAQQRAPGGPTFQSGWSELWWRPPSRELDRVLVALDGSTV